MSNPTSYAHPEVIVDTAWVAQNLDNPQVRLVEVNENPDLYATGHIPHAIHWHPDWRDYLSRDYLIDNRMTFVAERLLGISHDTILVFYGADYNWWAGFTFWLFKRFGHKDCRILNGGREKWIAEGRPLTTDKPKHPKTEHKFAKEPAALFRATAEEVTEHIQQGKRLVDVRSEDEYSGRQVFVPSSFSEMTFPAKGHIPTASNIEWKKTLNPDGTFKSAPELLALYEEAGITLQDEVIVYCSVGERSGHSWFVLKYLLGHPQVRNYDASWVEWGSREDLPRQRGLNPGKWPS
jgi:thiosulfate/3-mercaptopyruvate sulfurtransferase